MIRPVAAGDVPEVIQLVADTLAEFGLEFGKGSQTDEELHQLPASYAARGGQFWIARAESGELLGTAGMYPLSPTTFELRKMYLRPTSRGLGLGKQLLDTCAAWTQRRGGTHIVLDTMEKMQRAIAFYEAHGFVRDDTHIRGSRCSRGYIKAL
ncbi:MAG: GNAT family N-acetyltransferase [Myxococcota bacterium]|nr:GNAT family N-acetyltransferase [Myxococcota bacterium]